MKWAGSPPADVLCADGARPFFPYPVVAEEATNPRLRAYLATPPRAKGISREGLSRGLPESGGREWAWPGSAGAR
jgi:hypothetical protein